MVVQHHILPSTVSAHVFLPFLNPPFVALFFIPFASLPLLFSYALWIVINTFVLFLICYMGVREIRKKPITIKILMCIGIVSFIPVLTSLLIGQLSIIFCLIVLSVWITWKKGWELRSGLLIALLLIKPHFFILPFIATLLQRKPNFILGTCIGIIVLVSISYFCVGWNGLSSYFTLLQNASTWDSGYGIDIRAQHSLQTVLLLISPGHNLHAIRIQWYLAILLIIIPTLYIWLKQYQVNSIQASLQWAILILATLLTSPHTHFHDLTLITVVGVICACIISQHKITQRKIVSLFILFSYIIPLAGYIAEVYIHPSPGNGWIIITVLYMTFFWGFLIWMLQMIKK